MNSILKNNSITKFLTAISISILLPAFVGCDQKSEGQPKAAVSHEKASQPLMKQASPTKSTPFEMNQKMVVTSMLNAGQYLYLEGENKGVKTWIAATQLPVKVGDTIQYESGQTMQNFYSKTLDRTFENIIFTNLVQVLNSDGTVAATPKGHENSSVPQMENPHKNGLPTSVADMGAISIDKVEGGYTVEELYAQKDELNGQIVKVRGMVIKFLPGIMKRNWIHLQDGTGAEGTNDLTITTQELTKSGDTIICTGKLVIDRDFGQGYAYSLIMEDASITTK